MRVFFDERGSGPAVRLLHAGIADRSPPPLGSDDPSPELAAAWEAEESALEQGDLAGAVRAVVAAWLAPDAPEALREQIAAMQRRAFELQRDAPDVEEAPDPLEQAPHLIEDLRIPVLTVAGEDDMPDFERAAREIAERVPHAEFELISGAGHLAPLETPEQFRVLLRRLLDRLT